MPGNPLTDPQWAGNLADAIVRNVGLVRDKTTKPVVTIARAVVFGIIGAVGGLTVALLALIALVRGVVSILEWPFTHPTAVWATYLVLGGIFCLVGTLLMAKRQSKEKSVA